MNTTLETNGEVTRARLIREFNWEKRRYQGELQELKKWCELELNGIENRSDEYYLETFSCACTISINAQSNVFTAATIFGRMALLKETIRELSK